LDFRKLNTSPFLSKFIKAYRETVPFIEEDRMLQKDIAKSIAFIEQIRLENLEDFY